MIINFKTKKQESGATASVVDGKLILSLPDAVSPIVWQMDLGQAKASALEINHDEEKGQYALRLKTPKGENLEVAAFKSRNDALEGLMAASAALENAHGKIYAAGEKGSTSTKSVHVNMGTQKRTKRGKWTSALLALVLLIILLMVWSSTLPRAINTGGLGGTPGVATTNGAQPSSGVPMSADDFLSRQ